MTTIIHNNLPLLMEVLPKVDNINFLFEEEGNIGIISLSILNDKMKIFRYLIEYFKFDLKIKNNENLIPFDISMRKCNFFVMSKLLKVYENIFEIDSLFFENSRIHKSTFHYVFQWKIFSLKQFGNLNFKFK